MFLPTEGKCQIHYKAQMLEFFDLEFWYSFDIWALTYRFWLALKGLFHQSF